MTGPLTYLVCATERSGSTLLCEGLAQTGVAGRPAEHFERLAHTGLPRQPREYFEVWPDPSLGGRLPPLRRAAERPDGPALLDEARRAGTTPNGVFAAKLMWAHLEDFLGRFGPVPADHAERARRLRELFGEARYVRVVRRDKVRQAVSLWRAIQTAAWREPGDAGSARPRAEYDDAAIDHLVRRLAWHDRCWDELLSVGGIEPAHVVVYEDFVRDYPGTIRAVLEHVGLDPGEARIGDPPLRRQADELSEDWHRRYWERRGGGSVSRRGAPAPGEAPRPAAWSASPR